jgi:hypothetical protein
MRKRTKRFINNSIKTGCAAAGAGFLGANLADLITESEYIISAVSTGSQYIAPLYFLKLHAEESQDQYRENVTSKFKWKDFLKDVGRFNAAKIPLNCLYVTGRTFLETYLQKKGYAAGYASVISDLVCLSGYYTATIPLGMYLGITGKDELEETVTSELDDPEG